VAVGVERASPGSLACVGNPGNLVITAQTEALVAVVAVALVLVIRELLAIGGPAEASAAASRSNARRHLLRIAAVAAVAGILLPLTNALDATTPVFSLEGFRSELAAVLVLVPLAAVAWFVVSARDPRRFVAGTVAGIVGWFIVLYPNIAALPLPTSLVNAYQGLLPTYLYPFQFPVNTDPVPPGVSLFGVGPLLLFAGLVVFCLVLGYAAWVWRLTLAERAEDGDDATFEVPPLGEALP
jgi:hypothetical protein